MALMIPKIFNDTNSNAEEKIFYTLRETLSDDWIAIHSYRWLKFNPLKGRKIQGEGDFVIFNPKYGVLVIEVKGGGISYENGSWASIDYNGFKNNIQDPEKQASDTKYEIIRRFKSYGISNCKVWHAVWFPDINRINTNELPASLSKEIVLTSKDLENPLYALETAFNYWYKLMNSPRSKLDFEDCEKVKSVLVKRIRKLKTLSRISDDINDMYIRANGEQSKILEYLEEFNELTIEGRAGTGKTLLAFEKACNDVKKEKKVLFLCFNSELANKIRESFNKEYYKLHVHSIHSYALKYMETYHPSRIIGFKNEPDFEYLITEFEEVTEQKKEQFDSIIIDEGQDFKKEWVMAIRNLLMPKGNFYVFYDPYQELYSSCEKSDYSYLVYGMKTPVKLRKNMRNTDEIAKSLYNILELECEDDSLSNIHGPMPEIKYYNSSEYVLKNYKKVVNELINVKMIAPEKLTVLTLDNEKNINKYKLNEQIETTTVRKFKGLENDFIVVVDADLSHIIDPVKKRLLYAAVSRARVQTIMLFETNSIYKQFILDKWNCTEKEIDEKLKNYIVK